MSEQPVDQNPKKEEEKKVEGEAGEKKLYLDDVTGEMVSKK